MGLTLLIFVTGICKLALGLTCLQCDNVPQPRHCKTVGECFSGEVCGVEKFTNSFGEELFNVGCVENSKCTSSSNTDDCIECCQTDLCNAKGCGEKGYPLSRGPICYSCPVHTDSKPCHTIQFCGMGEVCMSEAQSEFGYIVYSSKCANTHVCKSDNFGGPNIVGRDLDGFSEDMAKRSVFGHVCRQCCHEDTCNRHCNSTNTGNSNNHCLSSPCQNGTCDNIPGDYVCVCDHGYEGKQCNIQSSLCQRRSPCMNGYCYDKPGDYVCVCDEGYGGKQCNKSTLVASDCYDILHMNLSRTSGVYSVTLWKSKRVIKVFCDMDTEKGGWTVFQRRFNGSVDFYRNFSEYENGFGSPMGELWLGLNSIQEMTATRSSELRIDLTSANGSHVYELFQHFSLGMAPKYTLHIDHGNGTAGDSRGLSYSNNYDFYTYDRDNGHSCAADDHGEWWYGTCVHANLNGEYGIPGKTSSYNSGEGGFIYRDFQSEYMLQESVLMFRRVTQN